MSVLKESISLRADVEQYLTQSSNQNKPVVVAWGLMNAGKSYLLNMLTQHIDTEFFKTNDFRETAEINQFEMPDCIYLDTPGLDANSDDNLIALKGIKQADVVLFVHQLQGELEAVEIDFLTDVRNSFGEYAQENIILILSKVDKEEPEKILQIQERVLEQCQEQLGFKPKCFQISNVYYQEGMISHTDELIEYSHMQDLQATLANVLESSVNDVRAERDQGEKERLLALCYQVLANLEKDQQDKTRTFEKDFNLFQEQMNHFQSFVNKKSTEYQNI